MRKNLLLYIIAFITIISMLFLLNREYSWLTLYSELSNRHNRVYSSYQNLHVQINNAAIINPNLVKATASKPFFTDSIAIIEQLNLLQSIVHDTVNIKIAGILNKTVRTELSWLLNSNVPDSIIAQRSLVHIAAFQSIDSLINRGTIRTQFLIEQRNKQLGYETAALKLWISFFIILAVSLLIFTTISLLKQQSKSKRTEQELEIVFNRINDSVVSVDNNWRYSFLNDTALSTHPLGKKETLGKSIWDVHPEMKGTIFWDKYHEAMITRKVVEIEEYYAPMDTWFSVKVYPSADGLTIFYKDITKNKKIEAEITQLNADLEKKVLERTDELLQAKNKLSATLKQASFSATIANNIQDPVIATDNDGVITHWNKGAELLLEWKAEEVIGKTGTGILNTNYLETTRQSVLDSLKEKNYWHGEIVYHTKSGRPVNVLITASQLRDGEGHVTGNLALVRDITERKKAEQQLQEFEHFFNNSNDFSGIANMEGYFEILNPSFNKILGYTQNELTTKPFIDFVHPDDLAATLEAYNQLKAGATVIHFVNRYFKKNGDYLWFDWNAAPNPVSGKLYCIARDITDKKKAEDALGKLNAALEQKVKDRTEAFRQSEEQYRHLFQNNPMPMWVIDLADFKFLDVNEMATLQYGYSREEFLSMTAMEIRPEEDRPAFLRSDHSYLTNEPNYNKGIWRHRKKDGAIIQVEIIAHKILFEGIPARLILAHDVTEQQQAEEKLVRNEKRFRALVENSNDIISLLNDKLLHLYRSPSAERITGFSLEERIKSGVMGEIHPEDNEYFEESLAMVRANPGKPVPFTYRLKHRDGHYIWLDGTYTNMMDEPAVGAIVGNMRDITERKELEVLLHKTNALARIGGWEMDLIKQTVYWSDITKEIHETENNHVPDLETGISFYKKGPGRDLIVQKVKDAIESGKPWDVELQIITAKNNERWIRTIGETEFVNGKCVKVFGSFQDIDQRKKSEEAIKEAETRYRNVVENMHEALIIEDMEGNLVYANTEFYRMFGYSQEEDKILSLGDYTAAASYDEVLERHNNRLKGMKVSEEFEYKGVRKDGTEIWIEARVSTIMENDKPVGTQSLERDITERKKAEAEIKMLNEDLEKKIIVRTEQLRKSNEELEAFSYSVSHDLRAPLRGIIGFTNILEEDYSSKLDDEAKRITAVIKNNTVKMGILIDDLLSFSRLGRLPITKIKVNFNEIINEVITELVIKSDQQQINWIIPVLPAIKADPNTIKQVWMNLIANAVKYSNKQKHPVIEIGTLPAKNETIFFVKDNGVGFDAKYKNKLFKVFQRLHSAAEFEGTGVGLAIVEKIITKHGGRVWAEAEPGKGACFYFSLPDE